MTSSITPALAATTVAMAIERAPTTSIPTKPLLYQEIQYRVVEILVEEYEESRATEEDLSIRQTLIALTKASKFFAEMPIIKATLVGDHKFEASVPDLEFLKTHWDNLTGMAPCFRNITLLPSVYHIDLTLHDFRELAQNFDSPVNNQLDFSYRGVIIYEGTHWDGDKVPVTDEEVEELYGLYRRRAKDDNNLLQSGELELAWTALFREVRKSINLSLPSFIYNHPLRSRDPNNILRDSSSKYYSQFLGLVVRSLTAAGTSIATLDIDYGMASAFTGWNSDAWSRLSLNSLRGLHFTSDVAWDDDERFTGDYLYSRNHAIETAIHNFLAKRPLGLTSFALYRAMDFTRTFGPSLASYGLTNLREITLIEVEINMPDFSHDISQMPALAIISLSDVCPRGAPPRAWKPMLDAIHAHSKPMELRIHKCWLHDSYKWSFKFPILDPATYVESLPQLRNKDKTDQALFKYLANCEEWTTQLQDLYG